MMRVVLTSAAVAMASANDNAFPPLYLNPCVNVEGDARYCFPTSHACTSTTFGACPKSGVHAHSHCTEDAPGFQASGAFAGKCVLPADTQCVKRESASPVTSVRRDVVPTPLKTTTWVCRNKVLSTSISLHRDMLGMLAFLRHDMKPSMLAFLHRDMKPGMLAFLHRDMKPGMLASLHRDMKPGMLAFLHRDMKPSMLAFLRHDMKPSMLAFLQREMKPSMLAFLRHDMKPGMLAFLQREMKLSMLAFLRHDMKLGMLAFLRHDMKPGMLAFRLFLRHLSKYSVGLTVGMVGVAAVVIVAFLAMRKRNSARYLDDQQDHLVTPAMPHPEQSGPNLLGSGALTPTLNTEKSKILSV
ncbi:hypothetical protein DYB32_005906 [Aphanomyces invadans]|uniref:Uncharacterized protein n=1 Tax=Aphanomyces invadans TaxID=157072 RepID=A0A418AT85_9STRA|nr:hypothetical protein DYB32_005906 [Aphanomyces invadans]